MDIYLWILVPSPSMFSALYSKLVCSVVMWHLHWMFNQNFKLNKSKIDFFPSKTCFLFIPLCVNNSIPRDLRMKAQNDSWLFLSQLFSHLIYKHDFFFLWLYLHLTCIVSPSFMLHASVLSLNLHHISFVHCLAFLHSFSVRHVLCEAGRMVFRSVSISLNIPKLLKTLSMFCFLWVLNDKHSLI